MTFDVYKIGSTELAVDVDSGRYVFAYVPTHNLVLLPPDKYVDEQMKVAIRDHSDVDDICSHEAIDALSRP